MTQICNSLEPLPPEDLKAKRSSARAGATATIAAAADCFQAIAFIEEGRTSVAPDVYLQRASVSLESATRHFDSAREYLPASRGEAFAEWVSETDFASLYEAASEHGLIPTNAEEWRRLVDLNKVGSQGELLSAVGVHIRTVLDQIERVRGALKEESGVGSLSGANLRLQAAVVNMLSFGHMLAFLNGQPTDSSVSIVGSGVRSQG